MPDPKWFLRKDPFSATVDLQDLGYGQVEVRSPTTAAFCEIAQEQQKHSARTVRGMACEIRAHVTAIVQAGACIVPAPGAPLPEWVQWTGETSSKVTLRLLAAGALLRVEAEETEGN